MKPLFPLAPFVMVLLEGSDGYYGIEHGTPEKHGQGCLPGVHAPNGTTTGLYGDQFGRKFSGHWVVPPGRHVYRSPVSKLMNFTFDTTLHYAAIHLHAFAQTLELRDLTTGQTVFTSHVKNFADRIGLEHVEELSSQEGIPVFKDHQYEIVSVYDNPTGVDQDAMATMFLYFLDKEFQKPQLASTVHPSPIVESDPE
jgi:hypothetical protein